MAGTLAAGRRMLLFFQCMSVSPKEDGWSVLPLASISIGAQAAIEHRADSRRLRGLSLCGCSGVGTDARHGNVARLALKAQALVVPDADPTARFSDRDVSAIAEMASFPLVSPRRVRTFFSYFQRPILAIQAESAAPTHHFPQKVCPAIRCFPSGRKATGITTPLIGSPIFLALF